MTCPWCGDKHGTKQLCQRAQRGMTRRSFCFLFGAGVAGAALALNAAPTFQFTGMTPMGETVPRYLSISGEVAPLAPVVTAKRIYAGFGDHHRHVATVPPSVAHMIVGEGVTFVDAAGQRVEPTWIAPGFAASGDERMKL